MFICHHHDPEDGFPNLEEGTEWIEDDQASQSSVVHKSVAKGSSLNPIVPQEVPVQLLPVLSFADVVGSISKF